MKRILSLMVLGLLLFAGCQREELLPTELKVKIETVTGTRVRFTVAPENPHAYYAYILINEKDGSFNNPLTEICKEEIELMEDALSSSSYEEENFLDIFFYRGSRQFTRGELYDDMDYKLIVFQINPKTHELIGDPVGTTFHTNPVPDRDLHFQVSFEGDLLTITPTDDYLTYFWQYEESEMIYNQYGGATSYLYAIAGLYQEYGFMDWNYYYGTSVFELSSENNMEDGTEYTLVICGCEEGELTTTSTIVKFIYHPGNIEVLSIEERDEWWADVSRSGLHPGTLFRDRQEQSTTTLTNSQSTK